MRALVSLRLAAVCAALGLLGAGRLPAAAAVALPPLNDPPTADRLVGKFVWADLFTTDPAVAAKFYEGLFGWTGKTIARDGHSYVLLHHEGRPLAGIVPRPLRNGPAARARWVGYLAVDDVARTLAATTKAGGAVLAPARDFPRRGTQAIVADNTGAVLGLLHSAAGDPPDYEAANGEWVWAELLVDRPETAATFYRDVFAHQITPAPPEEKKARFFLNAGGFARGGIAPLPAKDDARPGWLGFVRVASAAEAATRAAALGGRVLVTPRPSTVGTHFAVVADPTGAPVGVIDFADPVAAPKSP